MSNTATQQHCLLVTRTAPKPLRLSALVIGPLLAIMPFFTGCGPGEPGNQSTGSSASASASLSWDPVTEPSVSAYFVHYGRQSPGQAGSCIYEHSISVDSPSATVTDLDPNTLYYFTVSAYNGLESACSNEVSIVTSPAPVENATAPATFS
jgi:hypothetical protein